MLLDRSATSQMRNAHARRQILRTRGMCPDAVEATPDDDLEALMRLPMQLTLMGDDDPRWADGMDERLSTLYAIARMRGEQPDVPVIGLCGVAI